MIGYPKKTVFMVDTKHPMFMNIGRPECLVSLVFQGIFPILNIQWTLTSHSHGVPPSRWHLSWPPGPLPDATMASWCPLILKCNRRNLENHHET